MNKVLHYLESVAKSGQGTVSVEVMTHEELHQARNTAMSNQADLRHTALMSFIASAGLMALVGITSIIAQPVITVTLAVAVVGGLIKSSKEGGLSDRFAGAVKEISEEMSSRKPA